MYVPQCHRARKIVVCLKAIKECRKKRRNFFSLPHFLLLFSLLIVCDGCLTNGGDNGNDGNDDCYNSRKTRIHYPNRTHIHRTRKKFCFFFFFFFCRAFINFMICSLDVCLSLRDAPRTPTRRNDSTLRATQRNAADCGSFVKFWLS